MQETINADRNTQLSKQKFTVAISELIRAYLPNPEDPDPAPWPWRVLIRKAFEKVLAAYSTKVSLVALNPQPLPPKVLFSIALAEEVIERAYLLQEMASGFGNGSEELGGNIAGGYIKRFTDELCPPYSKIRFPKRPVPPWPPEPHPEWEGLELAVIGAVFQNEARFNGDGPLQTTFLEAAEKIQDAAFAST